ncbi:MAG: hypothetical protein AB7U20_06560 [Planctomycetaceae bacterium]
MRRRHLPVAAVAAVFLCLVPAGDRRTSAQNVVMFGNENMIQLTKENLIQNVFRNQQSVDGARRNAVNALDVQVDFVALIGSLSSEQRAKLELAGQGDIHRFFDDFDSYLRSAPTGQITMQQWNDVWQGLQPLQSRYSAGLHGPGSLFRKTIPSVLDEHQRTAYQDLEKERSRRHYLALIKATLSVIDGQIPLTTAQREQITRAVMEKTKPPRTFGQSYYQYYIVLYLMSGIEDDLQPLFEENEWPLMQKILQQGRQYEHMLRNNMGVVFE